MDRAEDNPWPEWPKVYKLDYGQEEAAARFGEDPRVYVTTVKSLNGDAGGASITDARCRSPGRRTRTGGWCRRKSPGSEEMPPQLVLLAMGFPGPEQPLLADLGIQTDARSNVAGRAWPVRDQRARGVCRGRLPARSEPGRVGHQRGPGRGARMRPISDG